MDDYQRHGELVDKKFLVGLTPDEESEMEAIRVRLDEQEASWYEPVKAELRRLIISALGLSEKQL